MAELIAKDQQQLLDIAIEVLALGVKEQSWKMGDDAVSPALLQRAASFVTLESGERLRGCIGSLQASRSLIDDVAVNAYNAGFCDPRFEPLKANELREIFVTISVLSSPIRMQFASEHELLQQLVPGKDGLILTEHNHRATFLPSVWQMLPSAELFLSQLKQKTGLPEDYWSDTLQVQRYHTQSFGRQCR